MKQVARFVVIGAVISMMAIVPDVFAQPGYSGYGGHGYSGGEYGDRDWSDRDGRSSEHGYDRDYRGRRHGGWERSGSVSIRNSRSSRLTVQLRDSDGDVRSTLYLSPGEREYVRTSARRSWTVTVRGYKYYRQYTLGDIGSFDDGRWYLRLH